MNTAAAPEGEKILIVDDDPGLRRLLERFLSEQGYRVRAVENVEQMDRLLARELLRDPYWPLHADDDLGGKKATWPAQYQRATHRDQPIHESDLRD